MLREIDRRLCLRFPRYKFWRICRALKIKPYGWQKKFALGPDPFMPLMPPVDGKATGKTTAVMLRLLMLDEPFNTRLILDADPDFDMVRIHWYESEWKRFQYPCLRAGIPVLDLTLRRAMGHLHGNP